jgi:hypothetical protein
MQIRLEITEAEIRALQKTYAEKSPTPRLTFEEWAGREIASHVSKACSLKGQWAVPGYVAVSVCVRESQQRLWEMSQVS